MITALGSADQNNLIRIRSWEDLQKQSTPYINKDMTKDPTTGRVLTKDPNLVASIVTGPNTNTTGTTIKAPAPVDPMHPILQGYAAMVGNSKFSANLASNPQMQSSLFDVDNAIKGQAGIFRNSQQGLQDGGSDTDGSPLYHAPEMKKANNIKAGEQNMTMFGQALDKLGAFSSPEEAATFTKYTKIASDPKFLANVTMQIAQGDKKGAVNTVMQQIGQPAMDSMFKDPQNKAGVATGFAVYNAVNNWEKMNDTQKSLTIMGLGVSSFKFTTGEDLNSKVLLKNDTPGGPSLTAGQAMSLVQSGVNVQHLMKNWGQLDAMQRLTYGVGTATQLAMTGKQMGLLGNSDSSAAVTNISAADLGKAGFTSAPSVGVGGVVGPANAVPKGYVVISEAGQGKVIAVPKGMEHTAANGSSLGNLSILNTAAGVNSVALGAARVHQSWGKGGTDAAANGLVGGTVMANGLNQLGQQNPYVLGGVVAMSVMGGAVKSGAASKALAVGTAGATGYAAVDGVSSAMAGGAQGGATYLGGAAAAAGAVYSGSKILGSDMSNKDKATALRKTGEDGVAAFYTFGASSLVQMADQKLLGGKIDKARTKADKFMNSPAGAVINPIGFATNLALEKGLGAVMKGKNQDQMARDSVRKMGQERGLIGADFTVKLADGTTADVGMDGKGGKHAFTDPSKIPKNAENRELHAYDIDYTNDLDFSANLATSALTRLLAGGKAAPIDQIAGQLANASISKIGYGQPMTEENYSTAMANVRGFAAQSGVQSKEDAYALANQAFSEGRMNEMDHTAALQGINMMFDKDSYRNASALMEGRHKGIEVAHDMGGSPGPKLQPDSTPPPMVNKPFIDGGAIGSPTALANTIAAATGAVKPLSTRFDLDSGNYLTIKNSGNFEKALSQWGSLAIEGQADPATQVRYDSLKGSKDLTMEEIRKLNIQKYGA